MMLGSIRRRIGYAAAAGLLALLSVVLAPTPAMAASSEPSDDILENGESRNPDLRVRIVVFGPSGHSLVEFIEPLDPPALLEEFPEGAFEALCSELQRKSTLFLSVTCDDRRLTFEISADDHDKVFRLQDLGDDVFAPFEEIEGIFHMRCNVIVVEPRLIHLHC